MPQNHSAHPARPQAPQSPPDDVAAFVAAHGVTICPPGQTSKKLKKPVRRKRRRLHPQALTVRKRKADKRSAFLKRKGRADWRRFKQEHPQLARERLEMLRHFETI